MGSVGQRPGLFLGFLRLKPLSNFLAPCGKIAHFRNSAAFASDHQDPSEIGILRDGSRRQREYPVKWLVGKGQPALCIELGNADRQLIEHLPLCIAESTELARLFLHLFDVDGISGNTFTNQRQVGDPQGAPLPAYRSRDDALDGLALVGCLLCYLRGACSVDRLDQFDLVGDDGICALRADRLYVSAVYEAQPGVLAAKPHRTGRGLDQSHERGKVIARPPSFCPQMLQFLVALAEVEDPDERGSSRRDFRIGEIPPHCEATR